jgi:hypothetical protein
MLKELTGTKETLEERIKELHEANIILKKNNGYLEEKNSDLNQKNHVNIKKTKFFF